jgi:hypothetical protein
MNYKPHIAKILHSATTQRITYCVSLLPATCKILSNILLSRLTPRVDESIGNHQSVFRHNRSTTDQIFCIHQILDKKGV